MLTYPLYIDNSYLLITEQTQIEVDFNIDDPDSISDFTKQNKAGLFSFLSAFALSASLRLTSLAVKDFYRGLIKDAKYSPFKLGQRLKEKLVELWSKTVGKAVEKFGELVQKAFNIISRYAKKPKIICGFVLMVAGLAFMIAAKASIPTDIEHFVNMSKLRTVTKRVLFNFRKLLSNKYGSIGLGLFTVGLVIFILGLRGQ